MLKSPSKQRERDFEIILACLNELGYSAEWRVVNAAQYGGAQRRRRTFIFAYRNITKYAKTTRDYSYKDIIGTKGFFARAFPVTNASITNGISIEEDLIKISDNFQFDFNKAGYMSNGHIVTAVVTEREIIAIPLKKVLQCNVDERYYITEAELPKWEYMKGAKKIPRTSSEGHE